MGEVVRKSCFPIGRSRTRGAYAFSFRLFSLLSIVIGAGALPIFSQTYTPQYAPAQQPTSYLKNSAAFRQEIARMEIKVVRDGQSLSITQIPRVQKDDVIKMRLLDEAVGGIKPDQSMWDWTFLVTYVNPNRNTDKQKSVSEEIQFRKRGWYKEYSFVVPYDSQPVFFLYPKPKYRDKILKVIDSKHEEVRKLGEKTIEIAGAYAQISSFLNELQIALYQTQYSRYNTNLYGGAYNSYGYYNPYNPNGNQNQDRPFNYNAFLEQTIERMAKSFNINMPQCWQGSGTTYNSYGGSIYGSYGSYGNNNQNNFGYAVSADLINRAQCVARNVRIEDFDFSISQMLKQGGILLATQLRDKYPQLAYWINIAAAALDFIVKAFRKSPLRIVPTIVSSNDNSSNGIYPQNNLQNNYSQGYSPGGANSAYSPNAAMQQPVKISLFAESQPGEQSFVTAYPIIVHKWQQEPDPEVISLYPPALAEPCLHAGMNILKNTNLTEDFSADTFTKNFKLVMSSSNGFRKEFPLKKNLGLGGWELNLTREDLNSFPKINMTLESFITGTRGFNEIKSPNFNLPISLGGTYELKPESQKAFSVGGKRTITLRNTIGNCLCLQAVVYKPSFGGQFIFEANSREASNQLQFSADGKEVSFEVDATYFQPGQGVLELKTFGGESANLNLKLYSAPPEITDVKMARGDRQAIIAGERLEQIRHVKINGKRATVIGGNAGSQPVNNLNNPSVNQNQGQSSAVQNPALIQNQAFLSAANALSANERLVVFDDASTKLSDGSVSLELELEENRSFRVSKAFPAALSRPAIVSGENGEIEGVSVSDALNKTKLAKNSFDLNKSTIFPIETTQISLSVENALTDYDFKAENISIETGIEKSRMSGDRVEISKASFEVLDWKNMRINLLINEQGLKMLGGRRLQFRIRDKERGDSDWYTIRQTFVRVSDVHSVKCAPEMNGMCEMKGEGVDYIARVSVDGGGTWYPGETATLQAQTVAEGIKSAMIPHYADKKLLVIKLRDFPQMEGLFCDGLHIYQSGKRKSSREKPGGSC